MTTRINTLNDISQRAALLDQLPVGITVIDLQGRILYCNDYCTRLVDRKEEVKNPGGHHFALRGGW